MIWQRQCVNLKSNKELMQAQEAVKADAEATALVRTFMAQQMQWGIC